MPHTATVRIWWFNQFGRLTRPAGLGHGSLELPACYGRPVEYITWHPHNYGHNLSFGADSLVYDPRGLESFQLPIYGRDHRAGLNASAIHSWWDSWRQANKYNLLLNNCDDTVVNALKAGGAELYAPCPGALIRGASSLKRWVLELGDRMQAAARKMDRAAEALESYRRQNNLTLDNRLWTFPEWKSKSGVKIGFRKEQVARMDQLLVDYHALGAIDHPLNLLNPVDLNKYIEGQRILNSILYQVMDHFDTKPKSDRRSAVVLLGLLVLRELERIQPVRK